MNREEFILTIWHRMWVAYQKGSQQPYNLEPTQHQRESILDGIKFRLNHPNASEKEMHDNWCKFKLEQGWIYGPVKDEEKKTHPNLIPYKELSLEERNKDWVANMAFFTANHLWLEIMKDVDKLLET